MKWVKNDTESDIFIAELGFNIPANHNQEISPIEITLWQYSDEVETLIASGDLIVNDTSTYYTVPAAGLAFLRS